MSFDIKSNVDLNLRFLSVYQFLPSVLIPFLNKSCVFAILNFEGILSTGL